MHLSKVLLKWFCSCFDGNHMLDDTSVISLQICINLGKYIFKLLKKWMNLHLSSGEQHFPKLAYLGSTFDPKLASSCCIDELFVFTLASFWNLLCKSNIPLRVLTALGMKFPWIAYLICNLDKCSSSSIMDSLKYSSFVKKSMIF